MRAHQFIVESAATELASALPGLKKHDYDTIDRLMHRIAKKHRITGDGLHDQFVDAYGCIPDTWIKRKKKKTNESSGEYSDYGQQPLVKEFINWAANILNLKSIPQFEFSYDTADAQDNHHTGKHVEGSGVCWVYVKNRNMVDIFRTIFHELVHVRQGEIGMIKPGDSYPGSPIEVMADALAGKYIKIFGKKHHEIFQ